MLTIFDKIEHILEGRRFWGFRASGILFYRKSDHKVCLFRRSHVMQSGTWGIPGGKIDSGEDPKEAALREVGEEVGGLPSGYLSNKTHIFQTSLSTEDYVSGDRDNPDENRYAREREVFKYTTFLYIVEDNEWSPELNYEHSAFDWFTLEALPNTLMLRDENGSVVKPVEQAIKALLR